MQAHTKSNWKHKYGKFSAMFFHPGDLNRNEGYENKNSNCKIREIELLGYKDKDILIIVELQDKREAASFMAYFEQFLPEVPCKIFEKLSFPHKVKIIFDETNAKKLNKALNIINNFELIEPLTTFTQMKKALGIDLADSAQTYLLEIENHYGKEKNFNAAFQLALRCKEAGYDGVIHHLARLCGKENDFYNLLKVFQDKEIPREDIFEIAHQLFTSDELLTFDNNREKLKYTLKLFSLCDSGPEQDEAIRLKARIFSELTGDSMSDFDSLMKSANAESLCAFADILYSKNQELEKLKNLLIVKNISEKDEGQNVIPNNTSNTALVFSNNNNNNQPIQESALYPTPEDPD